MDFPWTRRSRHDDADESIIDALNRLPPSYKDAVMIDPRTMPIVHINTPPKPNPPSKDDRRELHVTPPLGRPALPPPPPQPRLSVRARLMASIDTLPLFRDTARVKGWNMFIPSQRPRTTWTGGMQAINRYSTQSHRRLCQLTEQARGELWERARDYDMMEAEHRAKHPLTRTVRM